MRLPFAPLSAVNLPLAWLIAWQTIALAASTSAQESKEIPTSAIPASGSIALKDAFREYFTVGTAVSRAITTGRGFRRDETAVRQDIALVKRHFGQIVAENDMKWQLIHPRPGANGYDFGPADAFVAFGEANQMSLAGHTLVWHSQTPHWVFEGTHRPPADEKPIAPSPRSPGPPSFDLSGPRASRDELLSRMRDHIQTVMRRYRGKIKVWDVVNEAVSDGGPNVLRRSPWSVIVGPDFVEKAFEYAHEADPTAILRYNDYGLEHREKRRKVILLVGSLQERKIPIHAIGSQAHCNVSITFEQMDEALTELETLGLPIHITELDVNSATGGQGNVGADVGGNAAATAGGVVSDADKRLAKAYEGLFRAFVKHQRSIEMVTFWGPNDANSWRSQGRPLLFDGDNRAKPAFDAVIRVAAPQPPK